VCSGNVKYPEDAERKHGANLQGGADHDGRGVTLKIPNNDAGGSHGPGNQGGLPPTGMPKALTAQSPALNGTV
jgi:hypothetical protein